MVCVFLFSLTRGKKKLEKALNMAKDDIQNLNEKLFSLQTGRLILKFPFKKNAHVVYCWQCRIFAAVGMI